MTVTTLAQPGTCNNVCGPMKKGEQQRTLPAVDHYNWFIRKSVKVWRPLTDANCKSKVGHGRRRKP